MGDDRMPPGGPRPPIGTIRQPVYQGMEYADQNQVRVSLPADVVALRSRAKNKKQLTDGAPVQEAADVDVLENEAVFAKKYCAVAPIAVGSIEASYEGRNSNGLIVTSLNGMSKTEVDKYQVIGMSKTIQPIGTETHRHQHYEVDVVMTGTMPAKSIEYSFPPGTPLMFVVVPLSKLYQDNYHRIWNGKRTAILEPVANHKDPFMSEMHLIARMMRKDPTLTQRDHDLIRAHAGVFDLAELARKHNLTADVFVEFSTMIYNMVIDRINDIDAISVTPCDHVRNGSYMVNLRK